MTGSTWPTPDRSRLVDAGGVRVFVTDVGPLAAVPVVLLHDVLCTSHAWARVLESLPAHARAIAIDLPGCGESDRPAPPEYDDYRIERIARTLHDVLQQLDVARCELWGQGLGALVAMELATLAPARVVRLVAIGLGDSAAHLPHELRLAGLPALGTLAFARAYRRADLERTMRRWRAHSHADALAVDVYWDRLGRRGGMDAVCELLLQLEHVAVAKSRLVDTLVRTSLPLVLVWGDREVIAPSEQAGWRESLPTATPIVIEACGHAVAEDQPEALLAALAADGTTPLASGEAG
jgi:pimeloyl-ACP methyl ester carboxylesterase